MNEESVVYKKQFMGILDTYSSRAVGNLRDQKILYEDAEPTFSNLVSALEEVDGAQVEVSEVDGRKFANVTIDGKVAGAIQLAPEVSEEYRPTGLRELHVSLRRKYHLGSVVESVLGFQEVKYAPFQLFFVY